MPRRKRRLTKAELAELRAIMENAPQGRKPGVRFFAKRYGVNQPSIIKSLGGWKEIQRGRPQPPPKRLIPRAELGLGERGDTLEPYTIEPSENLKKQI